MRPGRWPRSGVPVLALGRGSNLVVSDDGFAGVVVRSGPGLSWVAVVEDGVVAAGAGHPVPLLARRGGRRRPGRAGVLRRDPGQRGRSGAHERRLSRHRTPPRGCVEPGSSICARQRWGHARRSISGCRTATATSPMTDVVVSATFRTIADRPAPGGGGHPGDHPLAPATPAGRDPECRERVQEPARRPRRPTHRRRRAEGHADGRRRGVRERTPTSSWPHAGATAARRAPPGDRGAQPGTGRVPAST